MPTPPRRVIENERQAWKALGILNRPDDQACILEIVQRVYAPIHNSYVFDGYPPNRFFRSAKAELLLELHYQIWHVPVAVRDHVPDEDELGLRLYDLILYKRANDPAWLHILPEWGFLTDATH